VSYSLVLLVAFADLAAIGKPATTDFAEPEWVATETLGMSGSYIFYFALYRDGNVVYRDADGNLAHVRLDAAGRRGLLRDLPTEQLDRLPKFVNADRACDDCSTYSLVHWRAGGAKTLVDVYGSRSQPAAFRAVYDRLVHFSSREATILDAATILVVFTPNGPPPYRPFPAGWPESLPKLVPAASQFNVVLNQAQLGAMRTFAYSLDRDAWRWAEVPMTPPAPHQDMWAH
jgi:hypothetical protein